MHDNNDIKEKTGNVFRCPHDSEHPFTIIANSLLRDAYLSFEALGLLCYLLSHSSKWRTRRSVICKERGIGKDKLKRLFDELITKGYMKMVWFNGENGYREVSYWFSERSQFKKCLPEAENPHTVLPRVDNPGTKEEQDLRITIYKKPKENIYTKEKPKYPIVEKDTENIKSSNEEIASSSSSLCAPLILGEIYKLVRLSPKQLESLIGEIGEDKAKYWIEELDGYIASTGKKYKNHLATIRNWVKSNASKQALQGENSHIAPHRRNFKTCFEKGKPPSGWKPDMVDVTAFLPEPRNNQGDST